MRRRFIEDKKAWDEKVEIAEKKKAEYEVTVKELMADFEMKIHSAFVEKPIPMIPLKKISFKTRTLPLFGGQVQDHQIDFKWTAQNDYERLGLRNLVILQKIKSDAGANGLSGI